MAATWSNGSKDELVSTWEDDIQSHILSMVTSSESESESPDSMGVDGLAGAKTSSLSSSVSDSSLSMPLKNSINPYCRIRHLNHQMSLTDIWQLYNQIK
ncbi:hypothetical protein DERP_011397 [Dermatophagoides pteronyssinus]|uniref:Uncharacterized protein n=1 Tax=Dermatophagoides pteronyssinus TaxID=6956 RepID=A0ABQ8J5D0_DERPT|nr:hypothetical protein DERP_011397 [Dermatophagoides pteronyssinus]